MERSLRTSELDLLARLGEHRPEDRGLILVDFADIMLGNDLRLSQVLDKHVRSQLQARPQDVFRLAGPRLAVIRQTPPAQDELDRLDRLSALTWRRGYGALDVRWAAGGPGIAALAERIKRDLGTATTLGEDERPMDQLAMVERTLRSADIASLVRDQPAMRVIKDGGGRPTGPVEPVFSELYVSIDELEQRLSQPLRRNPWLFDRVTALLDRSILRHVARDRAGGQRRFSINLHVSTVLDPTFARAATAIPVDDRSRLSVELLYWEALDDPIGFGRAVTRLGDLGLAVVLDQVPMVEEIRLPDPLSALSMVKFNSTETILRPEVDRRWFKRALERIGPAKAMICRCGSMPVIRYGLSEGVWIYQGRAIDRLIVDLRRARPSLGQNRPSPIDPWTATSIYDAEEADLAAEASARAHDPVMGAPGVVGWLRRRLFGDRRTMEP